MVSSIIASILHCTEGISSAIRDEKEIKGLELGRFKTPSQTT